MEKLCHAQSYLVGGLPRTGKSTLGARIAGDLGTELIKTDTLRVMFGGEAGSRLSYASGLSIKKVSKAFEPYLRAIVLNQPPTSGLVVEGELIKPHAAARIQAESTAISCFLGLNDPTVAFDRISQNDDPDDWMAKLERTNLASMLEIYCRRSDKLAAEYGKLGLQYYDASSQLTEVHDAAYNYLLHPLEILPTPPDEISTG